MAEVSVYEARNSFSKLIKRAQDGHETVITSHGRPVAKLVPIRASLPGPALAAWLGAHQVPTSEARSQQQADADLAAERDAW